jgi:hypothetical protein
MILRTKATFSAQGVAFRPSLANLPFTSFHDTGAIGVSGRYRGLPTPYGACDFDAPENEKEPILYLYRLVRPTLSILKKLGADSFSLHISYEADSGALGFSAAEIKMISDLECDVPIDLYIRNEEGA